MFFSNFLFSQNYYVNKYLGLNDSLENNELRIYVSHSGNTIDYDVFIMKINKKAELKHHTTLMYIMKMLKKTSSNYEV